MVVAKSESDAAHQARIIMERERGNVAKVDSCHAHIGVYQSRDRSEWLSKNWWEVDIWAFDVETTGLSPTNDRIVELGMAKYSNAKKCFESPQSYLINDGVMIPQFLIDKKINDITNEMLVGKPTFQDVLDDGVLDGIISDTSIVICHNRGFDFSFLSESIMRSSGARAANACISPVVCSMELALTLPLGQKNNKLETLSGLLLGESGPQTHRAGDDALMAGNLFLALARKSKDILSVRTVADFLTLSDKMSAI